MLGVLRRFDAMFEIETRAVRCVQHRPASPRRVGLRRRRVTNGLEDLVREQP